VCRPPPGRVGRPHCKRRSFVRRPSPTRPGGRSWAARFMRLRRHFRIYFERRPLARRARWYHLPALKEVTFDFMSMEASRMSNTKSVSLADWVTAGATALTAMVAILATWITRSARKSADRAADAAERSAEAAEHTLQLEQSRDLHVPPPTVGPSSMTPDSSRRRFPQT
jgi:hypothetical protein